VQSSGGGVSPPTSSPPLASPSSSSSSPSTTYTLPPSSGIERLSAGEPPARSPRPMTSAGSSNASSSQAAAGTGDGHGRGTDGCQDMRRSDLSRPKGFASVCNPLSNDQNLHVQITVNEPGRFAGAHLPRLVVVGRSACRMAKRTARARSWPCPSRVGGGGDLA
jgi:hypothetical protein